MEMHWHWLIVIYLFLGGLGAGAYLVSFAAEKGWLGKNSNLSRAGYYISAPVVAFGTVLLVFDLGQGLHKPWLLVRLLYNFGSVMTWGVYILSAFILIGFIKAFLVFMKKKAPTALNWAGAILALATGTYTGLLLWAVEAIPFWSTGIMPALFVVSALSTGLSATALLASVVEKGKASQGREGEAHLLLIAVELMIAITFFTIMLTGVKGPMGIQSAMMAVSGSYALLFWGVFIVLGLIFPLVVYILQFLQKRKSKIHSNTHSYVHIFSDVSVLLGGFALRAIIVLAALPLWNGLQL
ncbi:MAG: oxidoreductase [Gracilibacter sp. BRH_c7a]|nr:MAG: oxidoreductase [Gracilibacter sp. BRH_c7a]